MDHVDRSCILYCRYLCSKTVGCGICQWICRILEIVLYDLGKTIKNGVFMGMFYCMLGTLIQKIPQTKTVFICTISAFILYVVGVYFQYEWRKLLLPVVSVLVVESVIMLPLHIGSLGKWFRSMSTLLFLCHYIFVRAFECFPTLAVCFPEGIHKFMFVGVSAFLLSALLVWAGNKNKRIRWLWQ